MSSGRPSCPVRTIAAAPVASSSTTGPPRRGNARARTRPAASSAHAQAYSHPVPGGGAGRASTSATDPYRPVPRPAAHSPRAAIQSNSPSHRQFTSPAGGRSTAGAAPVVRSSHAVPTRGWPAKDMRSPGV